MFPSTTIYIPVQILLRLGIISFRTEIYIRVREYKFQYRWIYVLVQKHIYLWLFKLPILVTRASDLMTYLN